MTSNNNLKCLYKRQNLKSAYTRDKSSLMMILANSRPIFLFSIPYVHQNKLVNNRESVIVKKILQNL